MSAPILATKLYIPSARSKIVARPHLVKQLNEGIHKKLSLISTPAGFGKTTLLGEWLASFSRPVAWLSLDEADNDLTRFFSYLIAALQTVSEDIGISAKRLLQSPDPPPFETILTVLLNEITTHSDNIILILDDYHLIDSRKIDQVLSFLIEHLPPQMHLILATREDPNIPVARLRAKGQLTELRAPDLRFTTSEAAEFFNQTMGLQLTAQAINTLEQRTEGWITGLHLVALSLLGHQNTDDFIASFSGSHHFVLDYLVEEVLQLQSENIQDFLLSTSILERLSASLCNALRPHSEDSAQEILEYLERANLLLVPLDNKREWYRYHHLFADVLQVHLRKVQPNHIVDLHLRASVWYEQNGFRADAIHHALAAQDFERAADLIELEWFANNRTNLWSTTWMSQAQKLPDELIRSRVTLSIGLAWDYLFSGDLQSAEIRLQDANRLVVASPSDINEDQRALLALAGAFHAQAFGDIDSTIQHAHQALTNLHRENLYLIGIANSLLGLAYWAKGDLKTAVTHMSSAITNIRMAGRLLFAITSAYALAEIRIAQGRLYDAINVYKEALQFATIEGEPILSGIADLHLGLSKVYFEQGNDEASKKHLQICQSFGQQATMPDHQYALYLVQARIHEGQGVLNDALKAFELAEQNYRKGPIPIVRPIATWKVRIWLRQDKLDESLAWVRSKNLSIEDNLPYLQEFDYITFARVLIAYYKSGRSEEAVHEAIELLERLLRTSEENERIASQIEILILQTLAHDALGDKSSALTSLQSALELAEPESYVRIFVDENIPMARLLSEAKTHGIMPDFVNKLLDLFETKEPLSEQSTLSASPPLIEPLSERELEVLQLIAQGLSNHAIADRLFLAVSTIKGHNQRLFGKLGVQRRTEAVARARDLGLI